MELKEKTTIEAEIVTGYKCDGCGKVSNTRGLPNDWHHFDKHRNDWDNDNIESYEYYDVCSPECFVTVVNQCLEGTTKYDAIEISGFNIDFIRKLIAK